MGMIGSFASGANVTLVAKNRTKKIIPLLWIKSSKKPQIKKFHKTDTPKVGILIQNTISKFSKIKLKKDPLKFQKIKNIYKEASNQKVIENRPPPKSGNYDAKYKIEIFKNQ